MTNTEILAAEPEVSVIMAVFNGAQYLRQAIDSILSQTYPNFEFIIVDDGSTDDTGQIIASYHDHRLKVIKNPSNLGLTKSLNIGIKNSSGSLIARQDADDYSVHERLACQVAYLNEHPEVGLLGSGALWIDGQDNLIQKWQPLCGQVEIQKSLLTEVSFLHGTFMFRRSCLAEAGGGYDESKLVAQDCNLLLRISEKWELDNLPELLYVHRRHSNTVTARRKEEQVQSLSASRWEAITRRLEYGWSKLHFSGKPMPEWVRNANRRWLAKRYVWWSASARMISKSISLRFLWIALLLDPFSMTVWRYIGGIFRRKIR